MSAQSGQDQRTCQICGSVVPPGALYCPSCGARQTPVVSPGSLSFEDAIADVLDDDAYEETSAASWESPAERSDPPPFEPDLASPPPRQTFQPTSASPPPPPQQGWATSPQEQPTGWGNLPPSAEPTGTGRSRTLWIVLSIFGFITFCCCGITFLSVAVA